MIEFMKKIYASLLDNINVKHYNKNVNRLAHGLHRGIHQNSSKTLMK